MKLTRSLNTLKIPPTVQAILAARIDRLPADDKDLLQTLAVIGREFPLSLIRAVVTKSDDELNRLLNDLQLGEFIYEQPAVGDIEYTFKHALTQEVAYNSVLVERRKLCTSAPERRWSRCSPGSWRTIWTSWRIITAAAATRRSSTWGAPGQQALQRSAYADAIGNLTTAIDSSPGCRLALRVFMENCLTIQPLHYRYSPLKAGLRLKRSELTLACGALWRGRRILRAISGIV